LKEFPVKKSELLYPNSALFDKNQNMDDFSSLNIIIEADIQTPFDAFMKRASS